MDGNHGGIHGGNAGRGLIWEGLLGEVLYMRYMCLEGSRIQTCPDLGSQLSINYRFFFNFTKKKELKNIIDVIESYNVCLVHSA